MAKEWSSMSYANRKKVGALLVKEGMIISDGYNGTPKGMLNECEKDGETYWYVLHAESNAILKCANKGIPAEGSTLYVTMSPCRACSLLIHQSGIKRVVYEEDYRDRGGVTFLQERGIKVEKMSLNEDLHTN